MKELKELENAIKETVVYKNKTLAQWEAIADRRDAKLKAKQDKERHTESVTLKTTASKRSNYARRILKACSLK